MGGEKTQDRKAEYVEAVVRGAGFMSWQAKGMSEEEAAFRKQVEARKDRMLAARVKVKHPAMLTADEIEQARRNIESADWARTWFARQKAISDYVVAQSDGYVMKMISELTPWYSYGMTCPNCVGKKSQEGSGHSVVAWTYRKPDVLRCRYCQQVYPDPKYPETAKLVCPRSNQTLTFYLNEDERAHPEDRSGKYAWQWCRRPMHMSFAGVIRQRKASFMIRAARSLALTYQLTGDSRYAVKAIEILVRLAHCYRNWLYHDYWNTVADCDPMYAAWHDRALPLEWKRHLCTSAFRKDTLAEARMLRGYWGAGRLHPSCDIATTLIGLSFAYDLVHDARGADGESLWTAETRAKVERDLLMEWLMGGEPFLGGAGEAANINNKAGRVYRPMAAVARCLGITEWADTALRGFEALRDGSLTYDGFSGESPAYTFSSASYLGGLIGIAELLHGFRWPEGFAKRSGTVDLYEDPSRFRLLLRALLDHLRPDGRMMPVADTTVGSYPGQMFLEVGLKRCPDFYAGALGAIRPQARPSEYAVLHLDAKQVEREKANRDRLILPEICFPSWMTAILRHGQGREASALALTFSPPGGHRQADNLSLYYFDRGQTVLGDLGYVCDTPMNGWIKSTFSHNLVVVDDRPQLHRKGKARQPRLHMMATSPHVSVVEASSKVYDQCREYRRLVALIKGPNAQTFAVDVFRVKGGKKHAYRLFCELAASDSTDGAIELAGLTMPPEEPLPNVGASTRREDIFGLRDIRKAEAPPASWQAIWREKGRSYRLWMLTQASAVEASNGPGQETRRQMGRRVRYLDAIREGSDLTSTFVAVHEPSGPGGVMPIRQVHKLEVPSSAGPDAVAIRIESDWGTYLVFSDFAGEAEIEGVRLKGAFGVLCSPAQKRRWLFAVGAETLERHGFGFADKPARWSGKVERNTESVITAASPRPDDWPPLPDGCQSYVLAHDGSYDTGFPVREIGRRQITVRRFPLPQVKEFELPAMRHIMQ